MTETETTIKSERDYLWQRCNILYDAISQNGAMTAAMFRSAVGLAGNLFQSKGMDMAFSNKWFTALADFMEMVEQGRKQKVGPK